MNDDDLHQIQKVIEVLQKIPPSIRAEILLTAQFATIPLGI